MDSRGVCLYFEQRHPTAPSEARRCRIRAMLVAKVACDVLESQPAPGRVGHAETGLGFGELSDAIQSLLCFAVREKALLGFATWRRKMAVVAVVAALGILAFAWAPTRASRPQLRPLPGLRWRTPTLSERICETWI